MAFSLHSEVVAVDSACILFHRMKKCELCHAHLLAIKNDLPRASESSNGPVKRLYRELLSLYTTQLS